MQFTDVLLTALFTMATVFSVLAVLMGLVKLSSIAIRFIESNFIKSNNT